MRLWKGIVPIAAAMLLTVSTGAAAQAARMAAAPEPAAELVTEGDQLGNRGTTTAGVLFTFLAAILLIWADNDNDLPVSP
jgi:hypothetical protein